MSPAQRQGGGTHGTRTGPKRATWGIIVAVALTTATAAQAGSDGLNGRIAFERHTAGLSDIYITVRPVTEPDPGFIDPVPAIALPASRETDPTWAPGTDQAGDNPLPPALAFESDLGVDAEIYTLEPDSPTPQAVEFTNEPGSSTDPAWAPEWPLGDAPDPVDPADDRPPIAFVRGGDVFVKSFDRDVETNVTADGSGAPAGQATNPDWSPDGRHLTYENVQDGRHEIWVFRLGYEAGPPDEYTSSDFRSVTPGHPPSFKPSWFFYPQLPAELPPPVGVGEGPASPPAPAEECSKPPPEPPEPPGQCAFAPADRILFAGEDAQGDLEIFFATYEELDFERPYADAGHTTYWALTDNTVRDDAPAWSALGDRIVFETDVAGQSRLHVMDQDGEASAPLGIQTPPGSHDRNAAWEPLFNEADVETRRPCGRFSQRPRCRRVARIATPCRAGDPPPCPQPPSCRAGDPPPCPQPPSCSAGDPPPCPQPPSCSAGDPPPCPQIPRAKCTWRGTPRSDTKRGTPGRDVLCGGGGDDRLMARGGNDVLRGGEGRDRLRGGSGNDRLFGEQGADRLFGDAGTDRLFGGPDGDRLVGGSGRDRLLGEAGRDRLDARDRRPDIVLGGSGRDTALVDRTADTVRQIEAPRRP